MSMTCETIKVKRGGNEIMINKEDLQKDDKVISEKPAPKKKESKDAE